MKGGWKHAALRRKEGKVFRMKTRSSPLGPRRVISYVEEKPRGIGHIPEKVISVTRRVAGKQQCSDP